MQTTLVFYRSDHEAAERIADAIRENGGRGQVRCIRRFDGAAEAADAVRLAECLTQADIARLRALYGEKVSHAGRVTVAEADADFGKLPPADDKEKTCVPIPGDWRSMKYFAMRALASDIAGKAVSGKGDVVAVIEAELARR